MIDRKKIRLLVITLLSTLVVIFVSGIAVANNGAQIRDVIRMNTDITVAENQTVTNAVAIGGSVSILSGGRVRGDAVAIGGDVNLAANARVDGDAVAIVGQVLTEEGASIGGSEVVMFSNVRVLFDRFGLFGTIYLINTAISLLVLLIIFVCGVFLLLLLPGHLQTITATINQHPFKSGMWGLGGIVAVTLFVTLFAGSIVGTLLIPIVQLAFAVVGLLGSVVMGLWVGNKILPPRNSISFKQFLVGMLILALITLLPVAGGLIVLMLNLFGFGAVLLSRVGTVQPETIQKRFDQQEGTVQTFGT
jgi:hypothetical protein